MGMWMGKAKKAWRAAAVIMRLRRGEEGWTLIETLVVIGIGLLLMGSIAVYSFKATEIGMTTKARASVQGLCQALDLYFLDCGAYPTREQGLAALVKRPYLSPVPSAWNGPYIMGREIGADPWGREYRYTCPGPEGRPYELVCYGRDGREGGDGPDKDITSWD
jgi:general secretion pathway protein G